MSRTFRRKNYEATCACSWARKGDKTYGYFTVREYVHHGHYSYREPTGEEYYHEYWRIHGESRHANYWTPGRGYKEHRMNENRSINKRELIKWMKCPDDYEPLFEEEPRSHWWDWS